MVDAKRQRDFLVRGIAVVEGQMHLLPMRRIANLREYLAEVIGGDSIGVLEPLSGL